MRSLNTKLTFVYGTLGFTGLLLTLAFFYYASSTGIYQGAESRVDLLSDEISYSLEILVSQGDLFSAQRLIEKSSALEDIVKIIVVDSQQKILAHTDKKLVGESLNSPLVSKALLLRSKINQKLDGHIVFVSPLHGQAYTDEFHDVTGALWVEMDISQSLAQLRRTFGLISLTSLAILLPFYIAQYFTIRRVIIDRLRDIESGIAQSLQEEHLSALMVKTSFGSEDEINALAQTYNYLITSLYDSQKKLKSERDFAQHIMESMGEGLIILNDEGRFEYVNPTYARFLRSTPQQINGHKPEEFTIPEDHGSIAREWELRKGGKSSSYEMHLLAKDGTKTNVLITSVPRFADGIFLGSISVVTDISQRARLEQMKTDFINRASHELRTPLTTAIIMANLLEDDNTKEERRKFLDILNQELNRQRILLDDLLVAGRIESKRFEVHLATLEILPIIKEAISSVKPQADARQISIQLNAAPPLSMAVTDRQALLQVLLNLLSNAIKFSRPGSTIEIIAQDMKDSILIAVKDHGVGIPVQDLPQISDRFFRAQNATELEIPGTGIGLYIIKEILDALGGCMEIESVENEGTTVTISLPLPSEENKLDLLA